MPLGILTLLKDSFFWSGCFGTRSTIDRKERRVAVSQGTWSWRGVGLAWVHREADCQRGCDCTDTEVNEPCTRASMYAFGIRMDTTGGREGNVCTMKDLLVTEHHSFNG